MATITEFKGLLLKNPDVAKLIVPSARYEIYMDLNGDGKADFAFIDSSCNLEGKGATDTFGIDLGSDGEFDLYLKDSDGNWIPDEIVYFEDGKSKVNATSAPEHRAIIEQFLKEPAGIIVDVMTKLATGESDVEAFKKGMEAYKTALMGALKKLGEAAGK